MRRALLATMLFIGFIVSQSSTAGYIRQEVSFANLNALAQCGSPGYGCIQTWSGQGGSSPAVSYFFESFPLAAANASLFGTILSSVTWHLQGVLRVDFMLTIPTGYSTSASSFGGFPVFGIPIPGGQSVADRSIGAFVNMQCTGGKTCHAFAEVPFDITINVTDLSAYLDPHYYFGGFPLMAEATPMIAQDFIDSVPSYSATVLTHFVGATNSISLTYNFVPEPTPLALVVAGVIAGGLLRRQLSK